MVQVSLSVCNNNRKIMKEYGIMEYLTCHHYIIDVIGDMIAVYNMLHGKYDINHSDFFTFSPITHTRGHTFKLFKYFQEQMPGNIFYKKSC